MKKHKRDILALAAKYRDTGITPPCPYFGECGGCLFQDIAYADQLRLKADHLNTLFEGVAEVREVVPSPPLGYRNRMDYVRAFGKTGLRRAGRFRQVVDLLSCELLQNESRALFAELRPLLEEIEDYDYLRHSGYHRYVVLRQGYFTGETMMNFVVASEEDRISGPLAEVIAKADSSSLLLSDGMADLSFGREFLTIRKGFIHEEFDGIKFRITPNSFFQSNSPVARELYRRIAVEISGERVLDLYSGVGSISLYIASRAAHVTGVEISSEAVEAAEENKKLNGIENTRFACADAMDYLAEESGAFDTLVLDPPRAGMHPKALKRVIAAAPPKIIYVSCNPTAFRQDLASMEGYRLESFTAFDMFPQTPHVETLAVLVRK